MKFCFVFTYSSWDHYSSPTLIELGLGFRNYICKTHEGQYINIRHTLHISSPIFADTTYSLFHIKKIVINMVSLLPKERHKKWEGSDRKANLYRHHPTCPITLFIPAATNFNLINYG